MTPKIKICGMRDPKNIAEIAALGPDYMGFIFYAKSPRYVGENFSLDWFNFPVKKTGVFRGHSIDEVSEKVKELKLDAVQLHGDESPETAEKIRIFFPALEIWKAFAVGESFDFELLTPYAGSCSAFLFDTAAPEGGGSGQVFNWNILSKYDKKLPLILAGGIGPGNLDALKELEGKGIRVNMVDINSKAESAPGIKSAAAVKEIIQRIRA